MSTSNVTKQSKSKKRRVVFTPEEDCWLSTLVKQFGQESWDHISKCMIGRTPRQCRERWRSYLSPNIINGPWSKEEDEKLLSFYHQLGPKWVVISTFFQGRSDVNIKNRWYTYLSNKKDEHPNKDYQRIDIIDDESEMIFGEDWETINTFETFFNDTIYPL